MYIFIYVYLFIYLFSQSFEITCGWETHSLLEEEEQCFRDFCVSLVCFAKSVYGNAAVLHFYH